MNVETGQEQNFWINPQQRYGKLPQDMMFRFVRQAPIEIDAHNPNIVITARSSCTARSTAACTGRSSAPTYGERARRSRDVGRADHARHDR
jgi:hypothetical protein